MYTSLKSTIQGTPKGLWPEWIQKVDPKTGTLKNALWVQCGIISVFVLAVAFGGKGIDEFFNLLLVMTTIANTIPYAFLSGAFPAFKKLDLERPFMCSIRRRPAPRSPLSDRHRRHPLRQRVLHHRACHERRLVLHHLVRRRPAVLLRHRASSWWHATKKGPS